MAKAPLSIAREGEPTAPGASSALLQAKAFVASGHWVKARRVLEVALDGDSLQDPPRRAVALFALALLAADEGHRAEALRLLERAETLLVLTENEDAIVRWDIMLARSRALADSGRPTESAAAARTAIALFEDSDHIVAWHRPTLVELDRLASADDDLSTPFLLPKALGALSLADRPDAERWLELQESIVRELVRRGDDDLAADHAAKVLCALPVDLFGADEWWYEAMQFLGRMGKPGLLKSVLELQDAFMLVEREFSDICDYEAAAPLLPRDRATDR